MTVLEFIFRDWFHFLGSLVLISLIFRGINTFIHGWEGSDKGEE